MITMTRDGTVHIREKGVLKYLCKEKFKIYH